jgi:hypothetical protein
LRSENSEKRRLVIQIIEKLITIAFKDFKNEIEDKKTYSEPESRSCCASPSHK